MGGMIHSAHRAEAMAAVTASTGVYSVGIPGGIQPGFFAADTGRGEI